jgi:hypothetical protein
MRSRNCRPRFVYFEDRNRRLGGEVLDLAANVADRVLLVLVELLPAAAGEVGDRLGPVGIKLGALIFLQEFLATHAIALGQTQELALVLHQTLVDVVKLLDQRLDAGLIERQ